MKNNRNIIQHNSHQGAPLTGKQTSACASDLGDASHVNCCYSPERVLYPSTEPSRI